jgi:hypothetical protein
MAGFVLTTVSSAALVSAIAYVCRDWVPLKSRQESSMSITRDSKP